MSKPIPPAPQCFSCGRNLPEKDYNEFHERVDGGEPHHIVLDKMGYPIECCRRMFLGDPVEHRIIMGLYDLSTVNETPRIETVSKPKLLKPSDLI